MRRRRNQWLYSKESRKRVKPVRLTVAQQQQQLHEQQLKLLADAKRTLAASEQRLPITIQEWNHVKLTSKKLGVTKLQQLFSQCGDDYCRATKSLSTLAKLDAVQAIIGTPLETPETLLRGTDPIYISPDCKFQAFLESLLSELRDARRRELSQRSFFREIFDWSWKETVLQPLENLITLIEAVLRNGVWSPSLFPTLNPATLRNRQQYTLRGEHFVVRGADFVSGGLLRCLRENFAWKTGRRNPQCERAYYLGSADGRFRRNWCPLWKSRLDAESCSAKRRFPNWK